MGLAAANHRGWRTGNSGFGASEPREVGQMLHGVSGGGGETAGPESNQP